MNTFICRTSIVLGTVIRHGHQSYKYLISSEISILKISMFISKKQPKYLSMDDWINKISHTHTHTHIHNGILFNLTKERNPATCDNMDKPRGRYSKWNNPETERQILHDLIYMWNLKTLNSKMCLVGAEYGGNGELLIKGYKVCYAGWISS